MSAARFVEKGQQVFVTVSAIGRQMRFVPTRPVRESLWFIFAWTLSKTQLEIHELVFMSNHFHLVATDPLGELSQFLQNFDAMVSRQLNALRGTSGSNFERNPSWQRICDGPALVDKCVYSVVNPLRAGLVERLSGWKGVSTFNLEYGEAMTIPRPKCGIWAETKAPSNPRGKHASAGRWRYAGRSKAPDSVTLTLTRPDVRRDLSPRQLRTHIRECARNREAELRRERRNKRRAVLGWRAVVLQPPMAVPSTRGVLFQRKPTVTGTDKAKVAEMLTKNSMFAAEYKVAMVAHRAGKNPTFPYGTNQMARRYNVPCATSPPSPIATAPP